MPQAVGVDLSPLEALRAGTRCAHARLEAVPLLARLQAPDLSEADYVAVLRAMHGFHATVEPALAAALSGRPEAALLDGTRPLALAEDLAWFGAAPRRWTAGLPALPTPEAALGGLYVVEGSGLGARVIARHLERSLGVGCGTGASFYAGQDAETARLRWRRLMALLDAVEPSGVAGLVAGAGAVFGLLERAFASLPPWRVHQATCAAVAA